ncbi:efflux RND transporter periplasmic adaptor subunit [Pinibacter aurantiacus]|uniref:Efflux RND transporter periplasmic adaptor subunit n=1 Tax=Pinibacter aurantiacus TaxID=2851599 RepID=A0A9E2W2J2_9BACT|nr:efflux RND transporter periplasmic adaptor subunit [Pinibacter aurantiacus]MBV4357390.1 efflux RND transporter periplasmic adaptor subunit [Pinibacter aurantiacus]
MQRILNITLIALGTTLMVSCGSSDTSKKPVDIKKEELAKLKQDQEALNKKITSLEADIAKLDPSSVKAEKAKLVSVTALAPVPFTHYVDLQGKVDADNISYVAPRGGPGVVRALYVKKGDAVKKGQLLLKLDDAVVKQQLANAQTQLTFAKDLYQRRKNLWDQKIGAEVDLINAKNNVDQVENQIKLLQEQLGFTNVYADMNGVMDEVNVRVGETFTGMAGTAPQLRLVNTSALKAVVQVPESYQANVKVGSPVRITLPEVNNKVIMGKVHVAGRLIDPDTRTFYIEVQLPNDKDLRPNQIALAQIQDYSTPSVITIPINTLQTDDKGKYVLVATQDKGKLVAKKRPISIGQTYGDKVEIKGGLQQGDQLITEGFQSLYDGQLITTS